MYNTYLQKNVIFISTLNKKKNIEITLYFFKFIYMLELYIKIASISILVFRESTHILLNFSQYKLTIDNIML